MTDVRDLKASGQLELYVYGLLPQDEAAKITRLSNENNELLDEICQIERAVMALSSAFAPPISFAAMNHYEAKVSAPEDLSRQPRKRINWAAYLGWGLAILLLMTAGYLYKELDERNQRMTNRESQIQAQRDTIALMEADNLAAASALRIMRDTANTSFSLQGQPAAPDAYARMYWNRDSGQLYVDTAGLPPAPQGMSYQVWAIKLKPFMPISVGLLDEMEKHPHNLLALSEAAGADSFGITLEPSGGSASPTLEQLIVLGKP